MSWQLLKPNLCKLLSVVKRKCVRCPCYNRIDDVRFRQRSIQLSKQTRTSAFNSTSTTYQQPINLFSGSFLVGTERTMQTMWVSLRHVEQLWVSMIAGSVIFHLNRCQGTPTLRTWWPRVGVSETAVRKDTKVSFEKLKFLILRQGLPLFVTHCTCYNDSI